MPTVTKGQSFRGDCISACTGPDVLPEDLLAGPTPNAPSVTCAVNTNVESTMMASHRNARNVRRGSRQIGVAHATLAFSGRLQRRLSFDATVSGGAPNR